MTPYHFHNQNISFSDPFILHSLPSRRTAIARGKHCQSSAYFRSIEIQKLFCDHSDDHASEHRRLIKRIGFLTVHDIPRVYDASDTDWKSDSRLRYPAYQDTAIMNSFVMSL